MKSEQQRIAIAKVCGLSVEVIETGGYYAVIQRNEKHPNGYQKSDPYICRDSAIRKLPDYINDLNAMNAAEKVLSTEQRYVWCSYMDELCGNPLAARSATASQRAEAFLRTLNLWTE